MRVKLISKEDFIQEAEQIFVHGKRYDYSKVPDIIRATTKVTIICIEHGEFKQDKDHHIRLGHGCPKCSIIQGSNLRRHTTEDFVQQAKKVHGDKYNYSKVEYKGTHEKVCIICREHGEFWQTPANHILKAHPNGCPLCRYLTWDRLMRD